MRIDWFTVAAQLVNFLVLIWLLQRFLYAPITRAMARREQRIAERIREADLSRREAAKEAEQYRIKQQALLEEREAMMAEARDAAAATRKAIEQEAREEIEERRRSWLQELEAQQERLLKDLRQAAADRFWALAERALSDLADDVLEERIALVFARRIEALDADTAARIAVDCARHDGTVSVRSRFPLSANARRHLTRALHERLGLEARIDYSELPDLGCGIELIAGGRMLRWHLSDYLERFEAEVAERIAGVGAAGPSRGPA